MLSPTVVVPVSLVGAIIDRPLVRLKVIVFGATGASLPTVNVPYRLLGLYSLGLFMREMGALPYGGAELSALFLRKKRSLI